MMYNMNMFDTIVMKKKKIWVGPIAVGGGEPVSVQSMTNTRTSDTAATLNQILALQMAGCQIVRVGIPAKEDLAAFAVICRQSPLPVIADIHFHSDLALGAIDAGAQGIRINPGNIRDPRKLEPVVKRAGSARIPIRIGVNSGSLPQRIRDDYPNRAEGMVQLALETVKRFEDWGFDQIKISLKSSDIPTTVEANRLLFRRCPYPLHLGVTEAGDLERGVVASAMGIGALLLDGIGDTIRVSLTGDPVAEIRAAWQILDLLELGTRAVADVFSCPTCTRTQGDLLPIIGEVRRRLQEIPLTRRIRVAVMGCEVNGPGEASEADVGIAFSQAGAFLFAGGRNLGRYKPEAVADALIDWVVSNFGKGINQGE